MMSSKEQTGRGNVSMSRYDPVTIFEQFLHEESCDAKDKAGQAEDIHDIEFKKS